MVSLYPMDHYHACCYVNEEADFCAGYVPYGLLNGILIAVNVLQLLGRRSMWAVLLHAVITILPILIMIFAAAAVSRARAGWDRFSV